MTRIAPITTTADNGEVATEKARMSFYLSDTMLADEIRQTVYQHRMTLEEFFSEAARREIVRLKEDPPTRASHPKKLPVGRPIRPKDKPDGTGDDDE